MERRYVSVTHVHDRPRRRSASRTYALTRVPVAGSPVAVSARYQEESWPSIPEISSRLPDNTAGRLLLHAITVRPAGNYYSITLARSRAVVAIQRDKMAYRVAEACQRVLLQPFPFLSLSPSGCRQCES